MIASSVGKDRRINNLTTGAAFPRIESAHKIIILLSVHTAFAFWTSHLITSSFHRQLQVYDLLKVRGDITQDVPKKINQTRQTPQNH
jgi:hypothetical protein